MPSNDEAPEPSGETAVFRREGDEWTIVYGGTQLRLRHAKGLGYLAHLLRHPGRVFHVAELTAGGGDEGPQTAARDRPRGEPAERARKAVTNRIRDAVRRIRAHHDGLGLHLRNAVHTGMSCRYTPDRRIRWEG